MTTLGAPASFSEGLVLTKRAVESHINAVFLELNLSHTEEAGEIGPRVTAALLLPTDGSLVDGHPGTVG